MDLDAFRQPLQCLFQQHPVRLAYLFGSQATRRATTSWQIWLSEYLLRLKKPLNSYVTREYLSSHVCRHTGADGTVSQPSRPCLRAHRYRPCL
jgi:hypothetical protein